MPTFDELESIDVYAAAKRLRGVTTRTELRRSPALSALANGDVWLKLECAQVTGSFKLRGAFNAIATLPDEARAGGVVTSSAGNHGLGVAFAAHHFGVPAYIFVPSTAPQVKRAGIAALGATIDAEAPNYDAALARARAFAAERDLEFINPTGGVSLVAGQGTVALEIIEELPEVATVVVPVGGGGLLAGTGILLRRVAPGVRIVGAQSVNTAAMSRSLAEGRVVSIPSVATLADGLAGDIDEFGLDVARHALDEIVTVQESEIERAIAWLAREERLVVEGSGAVGVAAILARRIERIASPVAVVLSGMNIDPDRHARVLDAAA